jgi:ribosomal protein S18 acetylase RimI-like enzyme
MEQLEIFRASLEDAIEILALQKLAYQSEAQIYNDWTIPPLLQTAEEIQDEFSIHIFLKAVSKHLIVGSVRARTIGTTCHIGKLIVHPKWHNRKFGTHLLTSVEIMYRNISRFKLFTGSHSTKNLHLYHKLGYKEFRRDLLSSKLELVYLEKIVIDQHVYI